MQCGAHYIAPGARRELQFYTRYSGEKITKVRIARGCKLHMNAEVRERGERTWHF